MDLNKQKDVFVNEMQFDFGKALKFLKQGKKVTRVGWNGKNQFIYYVPKGAYEPCSEVGTTLVNSNGKVEYRPYIALKTVKGDIVPWQPTVSDCLAEDWVEVQ